MNTAFAILSGTTVPNNYSWDIDVPFTNTDGTSEDISVGDINTLSGLISGYSPGLKVVFANNSSNEYSYNISEKYEWNFGDYYNSVNNTAVLDNCIIPVEHTYIMPGTYTVTLKHTRTETPQIIDPALRACQGLYGYQWYWNNLSPNLAQSVTWGDLLPGTPRAKTWGDEGACFDKYCSFWSWKELKTGGTNSITWASTKVSSMSAKQWGSEGNGSVVCNNTTATVNTLVSTTSYTLINNILVSEILPVAGIAAVKSNITTLTNVASGVSPYAVRLTSRTSKPGSFPIDRIDWNFGDGSEIVSVTRYQTPNSSIFKLNNQFTDDPIDPRNYDVVHTYKRNINQHLLFYPSLTAYSSSTGSYDAVSFQLGPIVLPKINNGGSSINVKILKVRNTKKGNLYTLDVNGNITFATTASSAQTINTAVVIPTASNPIRDSVTNQYFTNGNPGGNYPQLYVPTCTPAEIVNIIVNDVYLVQEEDAGAPIYQISGDYIYV